MKQSIQLRLGQHLTMTPQLQQAIRLLQLSTIELQTEVQEILESNLMLESGENDNLDNKESSPNDSTNNETPASAEPSEKAGEETNFEINESIPDELPVDSAWEDTYDIGATTYTAPSDGDNRDFFETHDSGSESLQEHLQWQMEMTPFSPTDKTIAETIIDSINESGYLNVNLEEIHLGLEEALKAEVELDEIEAVLHRIQRFDPVGVGARNPGECLQIQLEQFDPEIRWCKEAMILVKEHLDLLGSRDYSQLMRRMKLSEAELTQVIQFIQTLNPRPGSSIASTAAAYVVPDVYVSKQNGQWQVRLNPEAAPKVRINSQYAGLVRRADTSDDNTYLKNHLQEARWFLKSLQSRNETLLKVATCIVERQRGFFEYGAEAMKPLVLRDVADIVEMHESTISRVTTNKYMHTPRGIFEFKFFFSSHVGTADGGECSATAIRAMIKKLVAAEKPSKPLSDSKIADFLSGEGIKVARRTIAKYREAMSIPPSNERKRLA